MAVGSFAGLSLAAKSCRNRDNAASAATRSFWMSSVRFVRAVPRTHSLAMACVSSRVLGSTDASASSTALAESFAKDESAAFGEATVVGETARPPKTGAADAAEATTASADVE